MDPEPSVPEGDGDEADEEDLWPFLGLGCRAEGFRE